MFLNRPFEACLKPLLAQYVDMRFLTGHWLHRSGGCQIRPYGWTSFRGTLTVAVGGSEGTGAKPLMKFQ